MNGPLSAPIDAIAPSRIIWNALAGAQAHNALGAGGARRFRHDIGPLAGLRDESSQSLTDLADLIRAHGPVALFRAGSSQTPPLVIAGTQIIKHAEGVQMLFMGSHAPSATGHVAMRRLGDGDYPEMLELARLTEPGPFAERTGDLGRFWGVFRAGRLVAMAGERLHVPGHVEVSGVCTHPDGRGQGLAAALIGKVVAQILADGLVPLLHSYAANEGALALYRRLGFAESARLHLTVYDAAP